MVEVSRNVVAILLVLVIVVSGFGSYSLLTRDRVVASNFDGGPASASVDLSVKPRMADGTVELTIQPGSAGITR